jgi:hypothetical protein
MYYFFTDHFALRVMYGASCRHSTARGTGVPCWHGTPPCLPVSPCLAVPWARPSAHDTAHGLNIRAVPPMAHDGDGGRTEGRGRPEAGGKGARSPE